MTFEEELDEIREDNETQHEHNNVQAFFTSDQISNIRGAIIATWYDEPVYFQDDGVAFDAVTARTILVRTFNRICSQEGE
jgi:hypothetical protein